MAGHDRMKGSANAAWNGVVKPSGPTKKYGDRVKNRRSGAPGGARAGTTARGTARCRLEKVRLSALRSPRACEGKGKGRRRPRAAPTKGAMNHALSLIHI